ncbi:MAG TPA: hypothetical protein VHV29_18825 [Terriglobales bacterium]|jgi:uncharacterized membrane protein|nr:hypothetical protein [Terriglobales bacterium]
MTITTNLAGKKAFSHRPATTNIETVLTLAGGAALAIYGALRRDWFGAALAGSGGYLVYRGVTDLRRPYQGRVREAFTINKSRLEVYDFVRNPDNWGASLREPKFEHDGQNNVTLRFGNEDGAEFSSRVELTDEKPEDFIAWSSDDQMIEHRGVVRFKQAPGDRGTEISIALEYKSPTGPISNALAALAGLHPEQLVREGLRQIKQLMETGEIPTTEGQPVGARGISGTTKRVLYHERPAIEMQPEQRLAGD